MGTVQAVSRGAHPMAIIFLIIGLLSLSLSIFLIFSCRPIWRLLFSEFLNALKCHLLLYVYNKFKGGSSALHGVSAWKGHYNRTEYWARLARPGTLNPMDIRVLLVFHTSNKASIAFGPQSFTTFVYGKMHREQLLTNLLKVRQYKV